MTDKRAGRHRPRRLPNTYGPALDYRTAGADGVPAESDAQEGGPLYPDYTALANEGLTGPVAAIGTESRPTGIRVLSGPAAANRQNPAPEEPSVAPAAEEGIRERAPGERWVAPPRPVPNPDGFRVSPAVRIIAPGTETGAPTARTPADGPRQRRRADLPAIPPPRWAPGVLPRPQEPPAPAGPTGVAHTATPGAPPVGRRGLPDAAVPSQTRPIQGPPRVPPPTPAGPPRPAAASPRPAAPPPPAAAPPPAAPPRPAAAPPRPPAPPRPAAPPPPAAAPQPAAPPPPASAPAPAGQATAAPPPPGIALNERLATPGAQLATPGAPPAEDRASFSRNTSLMAAGTLIARLTGFGKVLALAWVLGSGRLADAFNVANNLPNSIYDLLLGGVLSATLIPVFVDELRRENRREGARAVSAVVTTISALLVAMTALFWFITPVIIDVLLVDGHGSGSGQERHTAIQLLHYFVPQLPLLGAIAVSTALLNARRRFGAPAFSPILCNVVTIGAVVATKYVAHQVSLSDFQTDTAAVAVLGLGTTAGYLVQLLAQTPSMIRAGIRLRPVWEPGHPAVRTVLRLSVWTFGAVVTNQISFYVIQLLAVSKPGAVSSFNYAYQFFQLPYAIFAVSIASVIAPDLAQRWSNGQYRAFRSRMGSGIRLTVAILLPAGVGYAIVAQPLLRLALRHGSYSVYETHLTGVLVAIFALGLPGFSVYLLLMRAYQSMKDTRSMFWCYCGENALSIAVGGGLYPLWGVRGLVVGWVGSYSVFALVAFAHVRSRAGGLQGPAVLVSAVRVAIATAFMAVVLECLDRVLPTSDQLGLLLARVGVLVIAGSLVYVVAALWLGVGEVRQVLRRGVSPAG